MVINIIHSAFGSGKLKLTFLLNKEGGKISQEASYSTKSKLNNLQMCLPVLSKQTLRMPIYVRSDAPHGLRMHTSHTSQGD